MTFSFVVLFTRLLQGFPGDENALTVWSSPPHPNPKGTSLDLVRTKSHRLSVVAAPLPSLSAFRLTGHPVRSGLLSFLFGHLFFFFSALSWVRSWPIRESRTSKKRVMMNFS